MKGNASAAVADRGTAFDQGVMTVAEAVRFSSQSRSLLYQAMRDKRLAFYKRGCRRFLCKSDVIQWLSTQLQPGT